jgi:hypothetical protein
MMKDDPANVLRVTPAKQAEYSAFIRDVRSRLTRPEGARALAAYYAELDAARCKFFGIDQWPRGCKVVQMTKQEAANAATRAELERDYGLKFS